jgi:hypothetical protein
MLEFAIAAAPLLALLCALLLGRYPGCEAIVRLAERISPTRLDRSAADTRRSRRPLPPASFAVSGGLLIAFGLAQRPPPLAP